jgi:hypothetical protein
MREAAHAVGLNVAVLWLPALVSCLGKAPLARVGPARAPAQVPPRPAQEADRAGAGGGGGKRGRATSADPLPAHMPGSDADVIAQRLRAPQAERVSYLHPKTATVHVNVDMWATFYAPLLRALAWHLAGDTCRALRTTDHIVARIGDFLGALPKLDSAFILFAVCTSDEHGAVKEGRLTD